MQQTRRFKCIDFTISSSALFGILPKKKKKKKRRMKNNGNTPQTHEPK
jgi:hypothetical protein